MTPPASARILVVDDEPDLRTLYELTLLREGYGVDTADTVTSGLKALQERSYDVLVTDMNLPDGNGLQLLHAALAQGRRERCLVITAYGSAENAVSALKAGAFDYLSKPIDLRRLRQAVTAALQQDRPVAAAARRQDRPATAEADGASDAPRAESLGRLIGGSESMQAVRTRIQRVARSMAPVLVHGESGTGKELAARAIHDCSHRSDKPFVAVNCSAIPESLLEAEFFGSRKGAYTGAIQDRAGFFQAAQGGTLFLDEIGDLPLPMQAKLLRAIQERKVRPIGTTQEVAVDVRIVSATHKNLGAGVDDGTFRRDLFYRLNVIDIELPPLRERREDIPLLCEALLDRIAHDSGQPRTVLAPELLAQLMIHPLQGNVRELENLLHRAVALGDGKSLAPLCDTAAGQPGDQAHALPPMPAAACGASPAQDSPIPDDLQAHLDAYEAAIIQRALEQHQYNRTAAAARLGLSLRQIRYRIARLNIQVPGSDTEGLGPSAGCASDETPLAALAPFAPK